MLTLLLVEGREWSSRIIRWRTSSPFSHAATLWNPTSVLDSQGGHVGGAPPGVHIRPLSYLAGQKVKQFDLKVSAHAANVYRQWLLEQCGKPYDWAGVFGIGFNRDWRSPDSWFCSELVARGLEIAGIVPKLFTPANEIPPGTLGTVLSAIGAHVP